MKPTSKAPRIMRLKLKYDKPVSNFAFKFNLRRCIKAGSKLNETCHDGDTAVHYAAAGPRTMTVCP